MKPARLLLPATAVLIFLASCATDQSATRPEKTDGGETTKTVDFLTEVKPILETHCVICHNRKALQDRHSFETRKLLLKGDDKGPIIAPGNPGASRLLTAITSPEFHEQAMPPVGSRISEDEIGTLKQWILEGAEWPSGRAGRLSARTFPLE